MGLIFFAIVLTSIVVFTVVTVIRTWFDGQNGAFNIVLKSAMSILSIFIIWKLVALWAVIL